MYHNANPAAYAVKTPPVMYTMTPVSVADKSASIPAMNDMAPTLTADEEVEFSSPDLSKIVEAPIPSISPVMLELPDGKKVPICTTLDLANANLPPPLYLVEGMIGSGVTLLAGAPKSGKTLFALDLAHSVANGTPFLSRPSKNGEVLYFAFEESEARIKERILRMGLSPSPRCHIITERYTISNGLFEVVRAFCLNHSNVAVVVIDTLQWAREMNASANKYAIDVAEIAKFKVLAKEFNIDIILVHHTRKMDATDANDRISGTNGIAGTVDSILVLERDRKTNKAVLHVSGRDVGDDSIELYFDNETLRFNLINSYSAAAISRSVMPEYMQRFADAIAEQGGFRCDNAAFDKWLHDNVSPEVDVLTIKRNAHTYAKELAALGVYVLSSRTSKERRTWIEYYPPKNKTE